MKKNLLVAIFVLLIVGAGFGGTYYFYDKYQKAQYALDNPDVIAQNEVKQITDKLGKLIALPGDEEPSVATVLEKEKLQDQSFFKMAENGDKVVIYTKAMKAILYRPSENKIIEVAPIQITQPPEGETKGETSSEPEPTATPEPEPTEVPAAE